MEKAIAFGVPEERIRHLPYPIAAEDEAVAAPASDRASGSGYFLFAGRLAPEQGLRTLLAAAALAPRIRIEIAGDGPLRDEVAARGVSP